MNEIVTAFGLVLVIEGLLYAFVPGHLKHMMAMMQHLSDEALRMGGLVALAAGVGIVWIARSLFGG